MLGYVFDRDVFNVVAEVPRSAQGNPTRLNVIVGLRTCVAPDCVDLLQLKAVISIIGLKPHPRFGMTPTDATCLCLKDARAREYHKATVACKLDIPSAPG